MAQPPDNPFGRRAWFMRTRTGSDGRIARRLILQASQARHAIEPPRRPRTAMMPRGAGANWNPLGPAVVRQGQASGSPLVSGRITSLAVGPGGTRVYCGSANGGVWYSPDGGDTWSALDEYAVVPTTGPQGRHADSLAVGALSVQFGAARGSDRIFVGTGEANGSADAYFGVGIKYSTDGGATFQLEGTNLASAQVFKIVIDPDDPGICVWPPPRIGLFQRPKPVAAHRIGLGLACRSIPASPVIPRPT